jgi:hypothetical protein
MKLHTQLSSALLVVAALAFAGCVEEVGEDGLIDRTQANKILKTDMRGVWYEMGVISDMPPQSGLGFVGQVNFGDSDGKVVFDIQENFLVVYPFTERVLGADAKWTKKKIRTYWRPGHEQEFVELVVGNPTAMYPITGHFDVIRSYNPTTGSQGNVLVENSTDKPWFKRKYMRVDWMGNVLPNVMFPQGSVKYSSADHYVQESEKDDPNRFYFAHGKDHTGAKRLDYFHFVRRMFATPTSATACSTYSLAPQDCAGSQFDVRISYRRVDPMRVIDYEIRQYHNSDAQDKFGYFVADRYRFDEDYGLVYSGHDYKAQRWNLWQKSKTFKAVKADGTPAANGKDAQHCLTNADCQKPSQCVQKDWFELDADGRPAGVCSVGARMEYSQRGLRPIIYHTSAGFPLNHLGGNYDTADSWSEAFKETVSWLLFWEKKWGKAFEDGQSRFGERYCKTNADCSKHALAQLTVVQKGQKANRTIVGVGGNDGVVALDDVIADRPGLSGAAWAVLIHATPGGADATLDLGGLGTIAGVKFQAGQIAAKDRGVVTAKPTGKALTVTVKAGDKTAVLDNVVIKSGDVLHFVYYGGDKLAVLRSPTSKVGVRLFNAIPGDVSEVEAGINGIRARADMAFGDATDFVATFGDALHTTFVKPGDRGDVSCRSAQGVGTCVGWAQKITDEDRKLRQDIRAKLPEMFVLCENIHRPRTACKPDEIGNMAAYNDCRYYSKTDAKAKNPCADVTEGGFVPEAGKEKVVGDSRYSYFYWVPQVHASSPWGYGPSAADPDTGEIFWATANIYGHAQVTQSQYAKDLVDLLNGDLDPSDIATGKYVRDYVLGNSDGGKDKSLFGAALDESKPAKDASATEATVSLVELAKGLKPLTIDQRKLLKDLEKPAVLAKLIDETQPTFPIEQALARLDKIKGTTIERALINDEAALVFSEGKVQPGEAIPPELLGKISPTGWATPRRKLDERKRLQFLGIHSITPREFDDASLVGLAKRMKCQPGQNPTDKYEGSDKHLLDKACYKGDALRTALSVAIYRGVLEHEVGHTVGLRHNFEASTDLLNYFDGYFDEKTGREKSPHLCGDVTLPTGKIEAKAFCQNDEFGETCKMKECATSADCPGGTACAGKKCIDVNGTQVGTCWGKTPFTVACTDDAKCGEGSACVKGKCHDKAKCTTDAQCGDGFVCASGYCQNPQSKAFQTVLHVEEGKEEEILRYLPRAHMTAKEIENRRTEYQYSTVMDYGQRVHADIHGLGKYDYAAIKFGYGELVDVYAHPEYMIGQVKRYAKQTGSTFETASGYFMDTEGWRYDGRVTTQLDALNNWMPPELLKQRDAVPTHMVDYESANINHYGRRNADRTYFEVGYKYCSDEFAGNLGCYRFDMGSSPEEIVHHSAEMLTEYYLFDAFKRERQWFGRGGSPASYMARIDDRWLSPLADAGRFYALFNNIYNVYGFWGQWNNSEFGVMPLRRASENAFKALTAIITSPAPGSYVFNKATNTYEHVSFQQKAAGTQHSIPLGLGKYPWTSFAIDKGYYYYDHPLYIGSYWEKTAAIAAMCNSTANFLTDYVGEQLPLFRGTAIGFNTIYPKQLMLLLGGLAAGDTATIGGTFNANGQFVPFNPFNQAPAATAKVQPAILNAGMRLMSAYQAIANLPAGFDPSFTDAWTVWLDGQGNSHDFQDAKVAGGAEKLEVARFDDPWGKKTYVAPKPAYTADLYSPTYRVVRKLNLLKSGCEDGTACTNGTCGDGAACAGAKYLGNTSNGERDAIAKQMKSEIEVLDHYRHLYNLYGAIGLGQ